MKKCKQIELLAAAREKFSALSKAERAWKALLLVFDGVPAEHRAAAVARLRERAAARPDLLLVIKAVSKALKS